MIKTVLVTLAVVGFGTCYPTTTKKPFVDEYLPMLGHYDENGTFFSGDILPSPQSKAATKAESTRWPDATLVYEYAPSIPPSTRDAIESSLRGIENRTCIRFIQRANNEADYVAVTNQPSGCYSNLGRIGGRQQLNLGSGCVNTGTIQHEFMHALGFIHEHTRPDRDDYVYILYPNIFFFYWTQFTRQSEDRVTQLGLPYDFGSVMHYPLTAGSVTGFYTILPKSGTGGNTPGQRNGVSGLDVQKLNKLYCAQ